MSRASERAGDSNRETSPENREDQPGIAFVDGRYVPVAEASVPLLDRGFVRSDATYDVVHVWKGRFFRLQDHIDRFFRSMAALRMSLPYDKDEVAEILIECVRRGGLRDAYVQMTCTRGVPPPGVRDPRACRNRFYAHAVPFIWIANEEQRRRGLHLVVSSVQRIPPESIDPRVKNFHWLDLTKSIFEAQDRQGDVAVLVDRDGNLTEGAGFNIFLVRDGELRTPVAGVFEGMTRRTVFDLCALEGIPCAEGLIPAAEIKRADEVFLSSTAGGIMPVTLVNGQPVGDGRPGPLTRRLHDIYWSMQEEGWLGTPVDYDG